MVSSQVLRRDCTWSKRISWKQIERKRTYGNIALHCAGRLNFHEPVHMWLFHCWKMWGFRELSSSPETVNSSCSKGVTREECQTPSTPKGHKELSPNAVGWKASEHLTYLTTKRCPCCGSAPHSPLCWNRDFLAPATAKTEESSKFKNASTQSPRR